MSQATRSPLPHRYPALLSAALGIALAFATPGLAAAQVVSTAAAETAAPGSGTEVSWSVRPADTSQGRDRPNFAYELAPGGTLGDALVVTNRSPEAITLDVYAADGFLTEDGSLDILAGGEPSTELGSWVAIDSPQLTLASGESAEVPFDIAVPADTPPGDYAAGVVASMLVTADNGTITERRLGSRVHLRVLGDLAPALTVTSVAVDYHDTINPVQSGTATVTYTLTNTGNTRLDPAVDVSAAGPFGWASVSSADDVPALLPGSSMQRTVELTSVAPLALLTADVTATATVVSPGVTAAESLPSPAPASAAATTAAVPWSALALLLVAAGLVVWGLLSRKRRKAALQRKIDEAVAAARAEHAVADGPDAATPVSAGRSTASASS